MQLYVIANVCAHLPGLKASRNSNKLKKKIRIHQTGDLCNSLRLKLLRMEEETFKSHNKANFNDKVHTHGLPYIYFLIYFWSSELKADFCQLLLRRESTNSHLVIIYREVIFVHLYILLLDTLCNCIGTCNKSSLVREF